MFAFFLAILLGLEKFCWQSLFGSIIALLGISIAVRAQPGTEIPILSVLALIGGSAISAEGNVILKIFSPKSHPMVNNALTLSAGLLFLLAITFIVGETHNVSTMPATWMAIAYTVIPGSVVMFYLFIWILSR